VRGVGYRGGFGRGEGLWLDLVGLYLGSKAWHGGVFVLGWVKLRCVFFYKAGLLNSGGIMSCS